jgi:hypothetical protein
MRVEIAGQGYGIECGAGLVIGKLLKDVLCIGRVIEDSSLHVAGKIIDSSFQRFDGALQYALCALRIAIGKFVESALQTQGVQTVDGEDPDATLGAAGTARDVRATTLIGALQPIVQNMQ